MSSVSLRGGYMTSFELQTIEETLLSQYRAELEELDRCAHKLAVAIGKNDHISYYRNEYPLDIKRLQPPYDFCGRQSPREYQRTWRKL